MFAVLLCAGCAHSPPSNPDDPLETVNRHIWQFNLAADEYVLEPAARAYTTVTPDPVEVGIDNFLSNLFYPATIVNNLLQLDMRAFASDLTRFLVNSTVGVLGIFDVAENLGLAEHDEDFAQTLGVWGVDRGIYLMLPLLGPATSRRVAGYGVDYFLDPTFYIDDLAVQWSLNALYLLNLRASLLGFKETILNAFDPYIFVRTAYLQYRRAAVYDGSPPPVNFQSGAGE